MHINKLITLTAASMLFASCGDFLDKQPSVSQNTPVEKTSQLLALYDGTGNLTSYNYFAFYSTDDTELPKEMYALNQSQFNINYQVSNYTHFRDGIIADAQDLFWTGEYEKIYTLNLIINSASSVEGSEDELREALGCAHFLRAYIFFDMATYYCLPWCEANRGALGMPIRLGLDFDENVSRGTLEQTYTQIFADLQAADEYITRTDVDPDKPWRVSKCAINALYSRIYLARGEYEQALEYANAALSNAPALFDYNNFGWGTPASYPAAGDRPAETLEYCETNDWSTNKWLYFDEWIFPHLVENRAQWAMPSTSLTALYDQENDLRFELFFVEHGNRRMNVLYDWYRYTQFDDGRFIISGLTPQELMLNKAEILVRQGNWQEGLNVLTPLRETRYRTGTATALTASSQAEALKVVLDERRRELPFAFRLSDIKRFSVNETPDDDVTITRDFFDMTTTTVNTSSPKTWVIQGSSPALAMPIFQTEIDSSQGMIEQNPGE